MEKSITIAIQSNTTDMKKPYAFRLEESLVEDVRKLGEQDNRKLTPMIENILSIFVQQHKLGKAKPKVKSNGKGK